MFSRYAEQVSSNLILAGKSDDHITRFDCLSERPARFFTPLQRCSRLLLLHRIDVAWYFNRKRAGVLNLSTLCFTVDNVLHALR